MFDVWSAGNSVLREKVLEHVFLAELAKALLLKMHTPFEVLRAEFDAHGYDVVVEARGIVRHIQLKAMKAGGRRAKVDVSLELARKPGGCVIWLVVDERTLQPGPFYWLGGAPGEPLPPLQGRTTRHSRANAAGVKAERQGLREIPIRHFTRLESIEAVARALFGPAPDDHCALLQDHLSKRGVRLELPDIPLQLWWHDSVEFAHLIDGYALAESADLGNPYEFQASARAQAERTGSWVGSPLELWVALFLEHRRERFGGAIGLNLPPDEAPILDVLCDTLAGSLRKWRGAGRASDVRG